MFAQVDTLGLPINAIGQNHKAQSRTYFQFALIKCLLTERLMEGMKKNAI